MGRATRCSFFWCGRIFWLTPKLRHSPTLSFLLSSFVSHSSREPTRICAFKQPFVRTKQGFAPLAARPAPPLPMASFAANKAEKFPYRRQSVLLSQNGSHPQIPSFFVVYTKEKEHRRVFLFFVLDNQFWYNFKMGSFLSVMGANWCGWVQF